MRYKTDEGTEFTYELHNNVAVLETQDHKWTQMLMYAEGRGSMMTTTIRGPQGTVARRRYVVQVPPSVVLTPTAVAAVASLSAQALGLPVTFPKFTNLESL